MFHEEQCDFCGECLANCHYLDFNEETGGEAFRKLVAGEKAEWIYDCVTCIACNEYCPKDARPFDLILKKMEGEPKPVTPAERVMSICVMDGSMPWAIQGSLFQELTGELAAMRRPTIAGQL